MLQAFRPISKRLANITVWAAMLLVVLVAMIAFGVDVGYIVLARTQMQVAVDSATMAAAAVMADSDSAVLYEANRFASQHQLGSQPITLADSDVEFGTWASDTRTFTPLAAGLRGNAVRVTGRRSGEGLFFGRVLGTDTFGVDASAIAVTNPRDIVFVVDLSGSMNDDTEPCWATSTINATFASSGYPTIGNQIMADLFTDFGYGSFPGQYQHVGSGNPAEYEQRLTTIFERIINGGRMRLVQ